MGILFLLRNLTVRKIKIQEVNFWEKRKIQDTPKRLQGLYFILGTPHLYWNFSKFI